MWSAHSTGEQSRVARECCSASNGFSISNSGCADAVGFLTGMAGMAPERLLPGVMPPGMNARGRVGVNARYDRHVRAAARFAPVAAIAA